MRKLNTNDIVGQKFNKLTVLKYLYNKRTPHPCGRVGICYYYLCKCECGRIKQIERQSLIKNRTKSCGCIIKETRFKTHHYSRTRLYRIYCMMKDRCYNNKYKNICLVDWAKIFNISSQALSRYVKLYGWNNAVIHYRKRRIAEQKDVK